MDWRPHTCCFLLLLVGAGFSQAGQFVLNGGFENGFKGWQVTGDTYLETNSPLEGKVSGEIGPGPGTLTQRLEIGSGNDFTVSATIQSQRTNGWIFAVRFLDKGGREVMRVDSLTDLERDKKDPRRFSHYMKAHPLTRWVEITVSKDSSGGVVLVDQVALEMADENAANLRTGWDLNKAMEPFWASKKIYSEAVLMLSKDGEAATGQLMFKPTRIISVQDYGLLTNYEEGADYQVHGRTLVCSATSRMAHIRAEDLLKGELQWNNLGGKHVMVTYEHEDAWKHPTPQFLGDSLPHTMQRLTGRAPLKVVSYGDSITHGVGESRLSHIPPYLPPWPELFVHRLKAIYQDQQIELYNSAQSGADTRWGKKYAERMVSSLNPDLVIIAFGQNDFWGISANSFASNIADTLQAIRNKAPGVEFLLVSTLRFDPAYSSKSQYWELVGQYAAKLKSMTGPGVQFVDMTAISESVYADKKPKDCLSDPLHPNDYFARWYAQSLVAALDPVSGGTGSSLTTSSNKKDLGQLENNN